jgi:hypothetical protein
VKRKGENNIPNQDDKERSHHEHEVFELVENIAKCKL